MTKEVMNFDAFAVVFIKGKANLFAGSEADVHKELIAFLPIDAEVAALTKKLAVAHEDMANRTDHIDALTSKLTAAETKCRELDKNYHQVMEAARILSTERDGLILANAALKSICQPTDTGSLDALDTWHFDCLCGTVNRYNSNLPAHLAASKCIHCGTVAYRPSIPK